MSQILSEILQGLETEYLQRMSNLGLSEGKDAYATAESLCHEKLYLGSDLLAKIISQDPTLLAARAGELITDPKEQDNPSVGIIICSNIVEAAFEGLLGVAFEQGWLEIDDQGRIVSDLGDLNVVFPITEDYSRSSTAIENVSSRKKSRLNQIFQAAEQEYIQLLDNEAHDAYTLALQVSGNYAIFAPDDIAPLIEENPLLLGLRPDEIKNDEMFAGDPPAGIIISGHLTSILLEQLLTLAEERGCLAHDSTGHMIVPEGEEDNPVIH